METLQTGRRWIVLAVILLLVAGADAGSARADEAPSALPGVSLGAGTTPAAAAVPPTAGIRAVQANAILPQNLSPWGMFLGADIVVKAVMVGLAFASVVTWTVWLAKSLELLGATRRARRLLGLVASSRSLEEAHGQAGAGGSVVAYMVTAAAAEAELSAGTYGEGIKERAASRLDRLEAQGARRIARGTGVLATIGATAPFVGLFGTVWGIMNAFVGISRSQTTNLAVVAPGIAEALLATAIGLVAAIPAVVIYNVFARWTAGYRALLADASAEILRHLSRDLDRTRRPALRAAE